ncbi:MAG TPA: 16S rRNA (adenine(1518)-N(6)/adenine(1519)-N(6))-dimethyltransferase RsmA [Chloroflexota bacterium]|nr:16S rRNA (adenine(1518)-N(6)/adenine(1519)-N(6))-dimethyltransferase RsmA [Chloroflexota bacterium]
MKARPIVEHAPHDRQFYNLTEETRAILRSYHVRPKEQLGQHFLIDREALASILHAAAPSAQDQVLEIGPGIGTLTLALAATGARIHALELDQNMARISRARTVAYPNVTIHEGNVLHSDLATVLDVQRPFVVVANIPYYITAPILRLFLEGPYRPTSLILMVQREVGERLAATPGKMSALAVFTQIHARVEIVRTVPATSFLPSPEVDSVVLRLRLLAEPPVPPEEQPYLFRVVKAGFGSKRKMIHNALDHGLPNHGAVIDEALAAAGVDRNRRAETLSIAEWRALARLLRADQQHQAKRAGAPPS